MAFSAFELGEAKLYRREVGGVALVAEPLCTQAMGAVTHSALRSVNRSLLVGSR